MNNINKGIFETVNSLISSGGYDLVFNGLADKNY